MLMNYRRQIFFVEYNPIKRVFIIYRAEKVEDGIIFAEAA